MKVLETSQIEHFVERGYVRLDEAFPRSVPERGCEILWRDTGCDPLDRSTWTCPVIWLWDYDQEPFHQAVNMPLLHAAFDQLVGKGRWMARAECGQITMNLHWDGYGKDHKSPGTKTTIPALTEGFHDYGLLWTKEQYVFYVDGKEVWRSTARGVSQVPEYLKLTEEIGKRGGGITKSELPDYFEVDYVLVCGCRPLAQRKHGVGRAQDDFKSHEGSRRRARHVAGKGAAWGGRSGCGCHAMSCRIRRDPQFLLDTNG
jgi:hypothetical protein